MKKTLIAATVLAGAAVLATAAPAQAEATGTVMVRTQRTAAPNLASQHRGPEIQAWWKQGVAVSLECSVRGQPVKGWASNTLPNGGWDSLWYRTPSGDYIADVDISTGSNDSITPPC